MSEKRRPKRKTASAGPARRKNERSSLHGTGTPRAGAAGLSLRRQKTIDPSAPLDAHGRPPTVVTRWRVVEIEDWQHIVAVLVSGHERLPDGRWIVTSPLRALDEAVGLAVTRSTGRRYRLLAPLHGELPAEAVETIETACRAWGVDARYRENPNGRA
jgi:hypothetical protein